MQIPLKSKLLCHVNCKGLIFIMKDGHFKKYYLLIFTLVALFLSNCKSDKAIQGFELADKDVRGTIKSLTLKQLNVESTFSDTVANSGFSSLLLLGEFDNISSQLLLKFQAIPDSGNISRVTLVLTTSDLLSDASENSVFTTQVHAVTSEWEENQVTAASFNNAFSSESIASAEIQPISKVVVGVDTSGADITAAEQVRFEFNASGIDLVNSWIDTSMNKNYGVLINFQGSRFIKEFFSRTNLSNQPKLEIETFNGTKRDTVTVTASQDAFIAEKLFEPPAGPLYVDDLFSHQTVLEFDLSSISKESTINNASFKMTIDSQNTILNETTTILQIVRLKKEFVPLKTFTIDSSFVPLVVSVKRSDEEISVPIRFLLQGWVLQVLDNFGFIIRTAGPGRDANRLAFYSSNLNPEKSPRIEADFTVAPTN